jgi:hypothetical protein
MKINPELESVTLATASEYQLFGGFMRELPVGRHAYGVNGLLRDTAPADRTLALAMAKDARHIGAFLDPTGRIRPSDFGQILPENETVVDGYCLGILKRAALLVARQPTPPVCTKETSVMAEHNLLYREKRICEARLVGLLLLEGGVLQPTMSADVEDFMTAADDPRQEYQPSAGQAAKAHLDATARELTGHLGHPDQRDAVMAGYHKAHPLLVDLAAFYA